MAHHKRRKRKEARAGCLLCKPHKSCGAKHSTAQLPIVVKRVLLAPRANNW